MDQLVKDRSPRNEVSGVSGQGHTRNLLNQSSASFIPEGIVLGGAVTQDTSLVGEHPN